MKGKNDKCLQTHGAPHAMSSQARCPGFVCLRKMQHNNCQLKKNKQRESWELSFIWCKMRTIARETEFQKALRN